MRLEWDISLIIIGEKRRLRVSLGGVIFMITLYRWRKGGVILAAGLLAIAICSCANTGDSISPEEASTQIEEEIQAEGIQIDEELSAYVADGVILPEDFNFMLYPVEALMVGSYTQGLPYYSVEGQAKSFWFPMAVLSSLLEEHGILGNTLYDDYCLFSKEEIDSFASALYNRYASGDMKIPDTKDGEPYVIYHEDSGQYAMLYGNIGDLGIRITDCQTTQSGYLLTAELLNLESGEGITEFQVSMVPQTNPAGDGLFVYSIDDLKEVSAAREELKTTETQADSEAEILKSQSAGLRKDPEIDGGQNRNDISEIEEEGKKEVTQTREEDPVSPVSRDGIDQEEALSLAGSFLGGDHSYTFKQMVTLSDTEYYDFSLEEDDSGFTDVFVSVDGSDILTGRQNEDGSWTLDP